MNKILNLFYCPIFMKFLGPTSKEKRREFLKLTLVLLMPPKWFCTQNFGALSCNIFYNHCSFYWISFLLLPYFLSRLYSTHLLFYSSSFSCSLLLLPLIWFFFPIALSIFRFLVNFDLISEFWSKTDFETTARHFSIRFL